MALQNKSGKVSRMKACVAAFASACILAAMLPMTAMALPSPVGATATGDNGVTLHVDSTINAGAGAGNLVVVRTDTLASNVPAGQNVLASFDVYTDGALRAEDLSNISLTFNVGQQYAGATAYVYVQHNDGATEVIPVPVAADGSVAITVDRLSIFSIVVDSAKATSQAGTPATNKSATSPQTGIDTNVLAGATFACVIAAAGVAVALRRRGQND